jgi:hypothetical protein
MHRTRRLSASAAVFGTVLLAVAFGLQGTAWAASPTISVPTTALAGKNIVVSGTGWKASDTVRFYFGQGSTETFACSLSATSTGSLPSQACAVPTNIRAGVYKIQATDSTSTVNASVTTTLSPSFFLTSPTIFTSLASTGAGNLVDITGYGFGGNIASVVIGTTKVTPSTLSVTNGQYSASFTVPAATKAGAYTLTITDTGSHSATFKLRVYTPTFTSPASAAAGSPFQFSGGGWPAYDSLRIELVAGTLSGAVCSVTTDSTGAIPAQACSTPTSLPDRAYTVEATDGDVTSNLTAFSFAMQPALQLYAPLSAEFQVSDFGAGNPLELFGQGFGASGKITAIDFDSTALAFTATNLSSQGSFSSVLVTLPASATAGVHTITVKDSNKTPDTASAPIDIFRPTISVPTSGVNGGTFVASGTGFPSADRLSIRLITGPITNPLTTAYTSCSAGLITSGNGALPKTVCTWPTSLRVGTYEVEAVDQASSVIAPLASFVVHPAISLVSAAFSSAQVSVVSAGQELGISGTGFGGNIATAMIGTTAVTLSSKTVTNGAFSATFTVPASLAAGSYVITISDASKNSATADVTVFKPTISLGGASGAPGQGVVASGAGWVPNDRITVELIVGPVLQPTATYYACAVTADSGGTIEASTCTVPSSAPPGKYTLLAYNTSEALIATGSYTVS